MKHDITKIFNNSRIDPFGAAFGAAGHAELSTTQVYTQVSIRMLKEVHTRTHPAATLSSEAKAELDAEFADEAAEENGGLADE